ncbi:MAG: SAM-dependent chlorinase/fluorinase [Bacteroidota bacterium]
MAIITLTSDWGSGDHYAGAVKGAILSLLPDVTLVDITHHIPPYNLSHASFVVRNAYKSFPKGTIHIIDVCSDASIESPHTVILADGQYFIGADNGIFSLIFDKAPERIVEIDIMQDSPYFTFSARDVFAKVAAHIAMGNDLAGLGRDRPKIKQMNHFSPVVEKDVIRGKVIYIDSYENVFVNITETLFREVGKGRPFTISIRNPVDQVKRISTAYSDVGEAEIIAIFSSSGYLEVGLNRSNASSLLGLNPDDMVRIEFHEKP